MRQLLNSEDVEYDGPEMVISNSATCSQEEGEEPGVRLVRVYEHRILHKYYRTEDIPAKVVWED